MFDITPNDISQLNDIDLRELVGRLCEAELTSRGLSPAAVTWGGNQTAADGGLDVRVALPPDVSIDGFVPRRSTGFQVKKPDMPRAAIIAEMRPARTIRPVIQELADEAGAYVLVSSTGSTADRALRQRQDALRAALDGVTNADHLHTDFYDRTRLATWVRCHPGLMLWVKEKVGRALVGWHPYGAWSGTAEGVDAEYLLDDTLRLHLGTHRDAPAQSVDQSIDELRDELDQPGKIVRLVGLSGVGKTRLVQALFDARIGTRPLAPSLAVYTNLSDNPDPQPIGLVSDLMANRRRAILIVDNCPPDLHRRLAELCCGPHSTLSVLTVEYDVRDDQPEGTQVVTLDTSSPDLIEKLIQRRYPHLSQVDARTIADASGGNARIAIAIAETVGRSDTVAGLSNDELFQRLFRQRHDPNDSLLRAAKACSLVYSFDSEALSGDEAELPRLAALADQSAVQVYSHVAELLRRNLVQQRGIWRAVLPHAIANRLAAWALEETPYDLVNQQLIEGGTERLARSFSRRLSFLHDHPRAVDIVQRWLAPDGLLGDTMILNHLGRAMFENVAPVLPEATLASLERASNGDPALTMMMWRQHRSLLRSLAYDAPLFVRSAQLLARAATHTTDEQEAKQASETFSSLFTIYLSGTHATIEQRLGVIEELLRSGEAPARVLGLAALGEVLKTMHFTSHHRFEFGARSRDYGYHPRSGAEMTCWYGAALSLIERLALTEGLLKFELRDLLAWNFRGLWTIAHMYDNLEQLAHRFADDGFWREGWTACRETLQFDRDQLTPEAAARLAALEIDLRPSNLHERVLAVVVGDRSGSPNLADMDIEDDGTNVIERISASAYELGAAVATHDDVFAELLPDLLRGGNQVWVFGRGLAGASPDRRAIWVRLVEGLAQIAPEQRDVQVLVGFLAEIWERDQDLAHHLLDEAVDHPALGVFLPVLHSAVDLDEAGVNRLKQALRTGKAPIWMYRNVAYGRTTTPLASVVLKDLLLLMADQADGLDMAINILSLRLYSDSSVQRQHAPELLEAGREILRRVTFPRSQQGIDYRLANIVKACLIGPHADRIAAGVAMRLKQAVLAYETSAFQNHHLLRALLERQPAVVLDALFGGDEDDHWVGFNLFRSLGDLRGTPLDMISCEDLIGWCDRDGEQRYPLMASFITFAGGPEENGPSVWSEHAKALLAHAPNPRPVLEVFIERFRPMSWSGSRAALMEANAQLLDSLETDVLSRIMPFVTEAKARLSQEVAQMRQQETNEDRARDERFEW